MYRNESIYKNLPENYIGSDYNPETMLKDSVGRPVGAQPVDQFDAQPFMMGENGFRRSDIAILVNAESDDLKRAVAARLSEVQSDFPDQSLSDEQLAQLTIPRNVQSSSMFRDWSAQLEHSGFAKSVNAFKEELDKRQVSQQETIKFDSSNSNPE